MRLGVLYKTSIFYFQSIWKVIFRKFLRRSRAVKPEAKLTAKLTPVKAKMALRFKSTDVNMALISTLNLAI